MSKDFEVHIDGEIRVRFDRGRSLPGLERSRLDQLDEMLDQGIGTGPGRIEKPDNDAKTRFVVGELLKSLRLEDEEATARLCAYLCRLQPELVRLEATRRDDDLDVRLAYDS